MSNWHISAFPLPFVWGGPLHFGNRVAPETQRHVDHTSGSHSMARRPFAQNTMMKPGSASSPETSYNLFFFFRKLGFPDSVGVLNLVLFKMLFFIYI